MPSESLNASEGQLFSLNLTEWRGLEEFAYFNVTVITLSASATTTLSSRSSQPRARKRSLSVLILATFFRSLVFIAPFSLRAFQIAPANVPTVAVIILNEFCWLFFNQSYYSLLKSACKDTAKKWKSYSITRENICYVAYF